MPLVLEYRNSLADLLAQYELVSGEGYRSARSAHYKSVAFWSAMLLLAGYIAFRSDQYFLMCLLIAMGGWSLLRSLPYARKYWAAVEQSLASRAETDVRLEVREDGLHETVEGIESFVPWKSVKSFTIHRDAVFIELTANLWAIVPRSSVRPAPTAIDDLLRVLRDRGIKESPNQAVQRTGASRLSQEKNQTPVAAGSRR